MKKIKIFISYKINEIHNGEENSKDNETKDFFIAQKIKTDFKKRDFDVYAAEESHLSGKKWQQDINEHLNDSDILLLIANTEEYILESAAIQFEIQTFFNFINNGNSSNKKVYILCGDKFDHEKLAKEAEQKSKNNGPDFFEGKNPKAFEQTIKDLLTWHIVKVDFTKTEDLEKALETKFFDSFVQIRRTNYPNKDLIIDKKLNNTVKELKAVKPFIQKHQITNDEIKKSNPQDIPSKTYELYRKKFDNDNKLNDMINKCSNFLDLYKNLESANYNLNDLGPYSHVSKSDLEEFKEILSNAKEIKIAEKSTKWVISKQQLLFYTIKKYLKDDIDLTENNDKSLVAHYLVDFRFEKNTVFQSKSFQMPLNQILNRIKFTRQKQLLFFKKYSIQIENESNID